MILPDPKMYESWMDWGRALMKALTTKGDDVKEIADIKDILTYVPQNLALVSGLVTNATSILVSKPVNVKNASRQDYYRALILGEAGNTTGGGGAGSITFALGVFDGATDLGSAFCTLNIPNGVVGAPFVMDLTIRNAGQQGRLEFRGTGWGIVGPPLGGAPTDTYVADNVAPYNFATVDSVLKLTGVTSNGTTAVDLRSALVQFGRARP